MSFIAQHLSIDLFTERRRVAFRKEEFGRAVLNPDLGSLGDRPFRADGKPDAPVTHLYNLGALALGASRDGATPSETRS